MPANPRLRSHPLRATAAALRTGQRSLADYLHEVCDHIDRVEPEVQALVPEPDRRARLLREAADLEARYPQPDDEDQLEVEDEEGWNPLTARRPPLYGVLVGVKDIIRVDGFPTRCGSQLPPELFAGPEASCVTRLREAGALVLGKTVTTEFAYFQPGPTRNPWNLDHTPGGSSSGSAAAVAAGYCALALGSQTIGSVIRPAAYCGVVGYMPGSRLLPLDGVIPYAPSLDHLGVFVQHAADLELAMSVLSPGFRAEVPGFRAMAVPTGPYLEQATAEGRAALKAQVAHLESRGRTVLHAPMLDVDEINRVINDLAAAELALTHAEWFPRYEALYSPRTAEWIRYGRSISPERLAEVRRQAAELRDEIRATLPDTTRLELLHAKPRDMGAAWAAWICPAATGPAPEGIHATGNPCMNGPWTLADVPVVTVPAGVAENGLPHGLQCVGSHGQDEWLVSFANQIQQELEDVSYPWSRV